MTGSGLGLGSSTSFVSFAHILDPAFHRDYNAWHQLDHRPENLALPQIAYGERWVSSPDCAERTTCGDVRLAGTHYVNVYWFRDPAEDAIRSWQELAERSFQWGRRPEAAWATRPLMGFFSVVKAYAGPRVLVSTDALVFRPSLGVHIRLTRLVDPHSGATDALYARQDREVVPALLGVDGVAGVWTFSSQSTTLDPTYASQPGTSTTFAPSGADRGALRLQLAFLDADPLEVTASADALFASATDPDLEEVVFAGPLRTIVPWQWDWFDAPKP